MRKRGLDKGAGRRLRADNIAIVLVEPKGAGNMGSVARVMRNTGFDDLRLVNPADFKNDEAFSMACNAVDLLVNSKVFHDLDSALEDVKIVAGATRRKGRTRFPLVTLNEAIEKIIEFSANNRIAVLFGREAHGLANDEIKKCDILFDIPSHDDYPSLNLSHAVLAFCLGVFTSKNPSEKSFELAPRGELVKMYEHLEETLRGIGYGEKGGEELLRTIMRNFQRLFGRTGLMEKEVNMLRGIFTQISARTGREK